MSNDTTVYATLRSDSKSQLFAATAYLRNKDRTWRLDIDDVRGTENDYSVRIHGWANENSWNLAITGDMGEMGDLLRKFPEVEIDGWYQDEYGKGPLHEGEKSCESGTEQRSLTIEVGSFRKASMGWDEINNKDLFTDAFEKAYPLLEECGSGTSTPHDEDCPPQIEYDMTELSPDSEEICSEVCKTLRDMGAPKDFKVKLYEAWGDEFEQEVWGENSRDTKLVSVEEVDAFLERCLNEYSATPEDLLEKLPELKLADLLIKDKEYGENVLHLAAEKGLLDKVPEELLTQDELFRVNAYGHSPLELAFENNHEHQLPEAFQKESLYEDLKRKRFLDEWMKNERKDLVEEVLESFPNQLMEDDRAEL